MHVVSGVGSCLGREATLFHESISWRTDDKTLVVVLIARSLLPTEHTVFYDGHTGCSLLHTLDFRLDAVCGIQVRGGQFAQSLPFDLVPDPFVCLVEVITWTFL